MPAIIKSQFNSLYMVFKTHVRSYCFTVVGTEANISVYLTSVLYSSYTWANELSLMVSPIVHSIFDSNSSSMEN